MEDLEDAESSGKDMKTYLNHQIGVIPANC